MIVSVPPDEACIVPVLLRVTPSALLSCTVSAVLWFASIRPWLFRPIAPKPILPAPWIVWPAELVSTFAPARPQMTLLALLLSVTVPVPASVTLPSIRRFVCPPVEASAIVPSLVIVPATMPCWALLIRTSPVLVSVSSVAGLLSCTTPSPAVVTVPPVMRPPVTLTVEPASAWIVPFVLSRFVEVIVSVPPDEACIVPVLLRVTPAALLSCTVSAVLWFASIRPWLLRPIAPMPMLPAPWIVWPAELVSTFAAARPQIRLLPLLLSVTVPVPEKVVVAPIRRSVVEPEEFSPSVPAFTRLPVIDSVWPLLMPSVSPLLMVRSLMLALTFSETTESTALPPSMNTLSPTAGALPPIQLAPTFQLPGPPSQVTSAAGARAGVSPTSPAATPASRMLRYENLGANAFIPVTPRSRRRTQSGAGFFPQR